MSRLRLAGAILVALLPSPVKVWIYRRLFKYTVGRGVRIGLSAFAGVRHCEIGDGVSIGHLNLFIGSERIQIGEKARIGVLNVFRGGRSIVIGRYATILRLNVLNSIPEAEIVNEAAPEITVGDGAVITSSHWLDFTDRIEIGRHAIVGGRNSSFWTHNRQRTRQIAIGPHCYLGSEIRVAPGIEIGDSCIVALGSVLLEPVRESQVLIAGNPAKVVRPLTERDLFLVRRKTRNDLPDDLAGDVAAGLNGGTVSPERQTPVDA